MDNQPPQQPQEPTPTSPDTPQIPQQAPQAPQTPQPPQPPEQQPAPASATKKVPSLLGTIGLSLALLGVILSFIPSILIIGVMVLLVAFILSLIAVFKKNTLKWPAIVGLAISVIGGIIASALFVVALAVALTDRVNQELPSDTPSTNEQSDDSSSTEPKTKRPQTDEIATKLQTLLENEGFTGYKRVPNFYPCLAQELYKSNISDEALQLSIDGETPDESEKDVAGDAIQKSILTCDPDGKGI